jgi:drug/metabolite transporter (DMT)-like permease
MVSLKDPWVTSAYAISAVALWGLAFPLIQDGLAFFSPVMLGFLRFAFASALIVVVIALKYPIARIADVLRREWKPLALFGVLYVTVPNIAQNIGLQHGTSSIASVIQSSGPVIALVFAVILLKEKLTSVKALGTGIAMTGTILLVASGGLSLRDENFVSNILILISATSYGLAWVSAKRMLQRNPPLLVIGLSLVLGTALLSLVVPLEPGSAAVFNWNSLTNLVLLGFLCGSGSTVLYLYSLEREEVSRMAFFIYLMPIFASAFAWVLRGEGVALWTAVCGLVIVIGIAVATRVPRG